MSLKGTCQLVQTSQTRKLVRVCYGCSPLSVHLYTTCVICPSSPYRMPCVCFPIYLYFDTVPALVLFALPEGLDAFLHLHFLFCHTTPLPLPSAISKIERWEAESRENGESQEQCAVYLCQKLVKELQTHNIKYGQFSLCSHLHLIVIFTTTSSVLCA